MNLWNMLAMIAGGAAFGTSLAPALIMRRAGASPSLVAAALASFVLGVLACYALIALGSRIQRTIPNDAGGRTPPWLPLLYGGAVVWIFVAAYLANRATHALLVAL